MGVSRCSTTAVAEGLLESVVDAGITFDVLVDRGGGGGARTGADGRGVAPFLGPGMEA